MEKEMVIHYGNYKDECKNLHADANCSGGYEEMEKIMRDNSELYIWWD